VIRRATALLVLLTCSAVSAQVPVHKNLGATLSEDDGAAAVLEASLSAFLSEARSGQFSEACVALEQLERYGFFFKGLTGLGLGEHDSPPTVLKSYPLDERAAADFVRFKEFFSELTQVPDEHLDYYCFQSLDELLRSFGVVYDAGKCNFLKCDLGFTEDGGRRYLTGTGNPNYVFEYVGESLEHGLPRSEEMYWPFVRGMSCYYGGYALSGDSMAALKAQFREKLRAEPEIDFLVEFKKARKSSVNRHFSYFVMSAFLCQEVIEARGFDQALRLAYSGSDGARFFGELETVLGVGEAKFHDTIVRLIAEESSLVSAPTDRR